MFIDPNQFCRIIIIVRLVCKEKRTSCVNIKTTERFKLGSVLGSVVPLQVDGPDTDLIKQVSNVLQLNYFK